MTYNSFIAYFHKYDWLCHLATFSIPQLLLLRWPTDKAMPIIQYAINYCMSFKYRQSKLLGMALYYTSLIDYTIQIYVGQKIKENKWRVTVLESFFMPYQAMTTRTIKVVTVIEQCLKKQ